MVGELRKGFLLPVILAKDWFGVARTRLESDCVLVGVRQADLASVGALEAELHPADEAGEADDKQ